MTVLPFQPKPQRKNPGQDHCLHALIRSTLSLQEALDIVRSSGRRSHETAALLETFRTSLRSCHEATEAYMALAYPHRFKNEMADAP